MIYEAHCLRGESRLVMVLLVEQGFYECYGWLQADCIRLRCGYHGFDALQDLAAFRRQPPGKLIYQLVCGRHLVSHFFLLVIEGRSPKGYPGHGRTLYALAPLRALATEVKRVLLRLLARLGVEGDLAYRYPAVVAGVGALEAGVMRLYGVVVILRRWVRGMCAKLIHVNLLSRLAGSRAGASRCGAIFMS